MRFDLIFESIIKRTIREGGNAIANVDRIEKKLIAKTVSAFKRKILVPFFGGEDPGERMFLLGSTGKKPSSGDIDIGIDFPTRAKVSVYNIQPLRDKLLNPEGPNYNSKWTYMVMMKTALCKMFLDVHRALTLDVDTIVRGDLSPLWEIDLEDYYFAGAREPFWSDRFHRDYVNAGVLMWNFDKMRDGTADRIE